MLCRCLLASNVAKDDRDVILFTLLNLPFSPDACKIFFPLLQFSYFHKRLGGGFLIRPDWTVGSSFNLQTQIFPLSGKSLPIICLINASQPFFPLFLQCLLLICYIYRSYHFLFPQDFFSLNFSLYFDVCLP